MPLMLYIIYLTSSYIKNNISFIGSIKWYYVKTEFSFVEPTI